MHILCVNLSSIPVQLSGFVYLDCMYNFCAPKYEHTKQTKTIQHYCSLLTGPGVRCGPAWGHATSVLGTGLLYSPRNNRIFSKNHWTTISEKLFVYRVGYSLFGFSHKSLVFCERKSEIAAHSFPKTLLSLFKKERRSKEQRERFALGHKNEEKKQIKTVKNMVKTTN